MLKKLKHSVEYFFFLYFAAIFRIVPLKSAGTFAAFLIESIVVLFKADRVAKANLQKIFPEKSLMEIAQIKREVWGNLGRNFAEYAHFSEMTNDDIMEMVEIVGEKHMKKYLGKNKPVIFFTGHYGNWELANIVLAIKGYKMNTIYRPANNTYIDNKVAKFRMKNRDVKLYKKGASDSIGFLKALKKGEAGGMLIDQKYGEGIKVPFMGHEASCSTFVANVAKKYDIPLVPTRVKRIAGDKFQVIFDKPIEPKEIKDKSEYEILLMLNKVIEQWIREVPGHWFWVHNRWS